ncbi:hypothetical protein [Adhaeribacter aquaticus]|uniref:hypothetical protein n=1 Tax=Adhaeribacter aquaticus TaxID=299567 RepID=UPI000478E924|nr:hypothetical protein [Adhaeribacter aquaticus]
MTLFLRVLFIVLMVIGGVVGCANRGDKAVNVSGEDSGNYFQKDWALNKFWDDGLAEVATYSAERIIYNKVRTFDFVLITVKEDFNEEFNVKTDDYKRKDLFPVIKVNQFCRIETANYPYHFLSSLFFKRDNPVSIHKATISSQEWCGNTFKAITKKGNQLKYSFNSYWDNQGEGQISLSADLLLEDQLVYTLRTLKFEKGVSFSAKVAEWLQTNKATKPTIYQANFKISAVTTESGDSAWQVNLQLDDKKLNTYLFATAYPNVLISQKTWDNRNLKLKEIKRNAYWQH